MKKGDTVERYLEGIWFLAIIQDVHKIDKSLTLKYIDDGNIESHVPLEEVRISQKGSQSSFGMLSPTKKDTLMRPLAGLVEDDYEIRNKHQPTVIVHNNMNDGAIILNGAENKLAAGGGLRALRYLKK